MADRPWSVRVAFAPGGSFAYRPGEVLVRGDDFNRAEEIIIELARVSGIVRRETGEPGSDDSVGSFARITGVSDALDAIAKLNQAGIYAQPNHVLFAHNSGDGSVQANPFYANPFYANPFYANPFYANPFYANPFYANPFYANPFSANTNPAFDPNYRQTGRRPSSARPSEGPVHAPFSPVPADPGEVSIIILDTGYAGPNAATTAASGPEEPDSGNKGYLDPVAGHGTFIAGIIDQLVPGCTISVANVIAPEGDGDEVKIGQALNKLAGNNKLFVNLSFGGYSETGMGAIAEAVARLSNAGSVVVASAGNDGVGVPMYPAALPHVLAVGALDHENNPAPFTNYGPWVRACTLGVEVVSSFFKWDGRHPTQSRSDIDRFEGLAVWSGTSFAAPRVVAALAHHVLTTTNATAHDAVKAVVDASGLERRTLLGTVVKPLPLHNPTAKS